MTRTLKLIASIGIAGMLLANCGKNPLGPGAPGGLSLFAKIGKAMSKPAAVNNEQNSKDGTKSTLGSGVSKAYLGKVLSGQAAPGVVFDTLYDMPTANTYMYQQRVADKPNDDDPMKHSTGTGEIVFKYSGNPRVAFNAMYITNIISFHFIGREQKIWNNEIDSLDVTVTFSVTEIADFKPGLTTMWAKNITGDITKGDGDTAKFSVEALDETILNHPVQSGSGVFYDAHSGNDQSGEAKSFSFNLKILFQNTQDSTKPYRRYQDNEGIITFSLPWAQDSLAFNIHFYSQNKLLENTYDREGNIYKHDENGARVVYFKSNERTGKYVIVYYDDSNKETNRESN